MQEDKLEKSVTVFQGNRDSELLAMDWSWRVLGRNSFQSTPGVPGIRVGALLRRPVIVLVSSTSLCPQAQISIQRNGVHSPAS